MDIRRFELRWHQHQSTVVAEVGSLYRDSALVDVTLACEDQRTYQAHKLVLSACSQYFQGLFARHASHQHPIIFLKDVKGDECEAILTYMYKGEVSVSQEQIHRILRVANSLQVRGLVEMATSSSSSRPSTPVKIEGRCASSSPSTGPPTKSATPLSEPSRSPHPPVAPTPPLGLSHLPPDSPPPRPVLPPSSHLPSGDYTPYHLFPSRSYDLLPLPTALHGDMKRNNDFSKGSPSSSYVPPLRVKKDLGCNSWDGPAVDVGGLSPLSSLSDSQRPPYLPSNIFQSFFSPESQASSSQTYGRMFPICDPLRRLSPSSGDTRIHKCQYCQRKFKRKDHLKTHVRIHTGERPYKCRICGRGFIQSQQVKIHMKVHIREDATLNASGLSSVGGNVSLSSLYPDLGHHLGGEHHSSGGGGGSGGIGPSSNESPADLEGGHDHTPQDSDNDFSSEAQNADFDIHGRLRQATSPVSSTVSNSKKSQPSSSISYSSLTENKTSVPLRPAPVSPPTRIMSDSSKNGRTINKDDECNSAIKEPYHLGRKK